MNGEALSRLAEAVNERLDRVAAGVDELRQRAPSGEDAQAMPAAVLRIERSVAEHGRKLENLEDRMTATQLEVARRAGGLKFLWGLAIAAGGVLAGVLVPKVAGLLFGGGP